MNELLHAVAEIFDQFFARQDYFLTGAVASLCLVVGTLGLWLGGKVLGGSRDSLFMSFLMLAAGVVLVTVGWVLPGLFGFHAAWAAAVSAGLVFMVVVGLTAHVQRGGFFAALGAWIVAGLVIAGVLMIEPYVRESIRGGVERAERMKERRQEGLPVW